MPRRVPHDDTDAAAERMSGLPGGCAFPGLPE